MAQPPRVLFVDDEESIRATLPLMLKSHGFEVISVGTVPEALRLVSQEKFDVLIADLNVGSPSDGFTVVSAMRRTQPQAVNFILTGYPAFETALAAIRQQVDDYVTKPTDIESLVTSIKEKLSNRKPAQGIQPKRLADIIEKNREWIAEHWLAEVNRDPEISAVRLRDSERVDHIPRLLQEVLERAKGRESTPQAAEAAALHGRVRRSQGYSAPLVVREAKLLLQVVAECVQQNLLAIQVSNLIPDMLKIWEIILGELQLSLAALLEIDRNPSNPKPLPGKRGGRRAE
jgi:DNA-binding response OmpR family regulator